MKKYTLTEEHKAQFGPWRDKWIANAMSTKPMDDEDRAIMRKAIKGLYEAGGLTPPPEQMKETYRTATSVLMLLFLALLFLAIWTEYHMQFGLTSIVILYLASCANDCAKENQ